MFFRALAALVAADAFDRRMRERQRRAWIAADHARAVERRPQRVSPTRRAGADRNASADVRSGTSRS